MQINQEREGLQIDCILLKNALDIFVEISDYRGVNYYGDFEQIMLTEISGYYSRLASEWLLCDSSAEYVHKVFCCQIMYLSYIHLTVIDNILPVYGLLNFPGVLVLESRETKS